MGSLGLVWKRVAAAVGTGAALMVAMGCGSPGTPTTTPSPSTPAPAAAIGRCGSVSDAQIAQATGLSGLQQVSANPLRCAWETGGGADYSVVFEWFRGTPLADRRTQVTLGTSASAQVAGHSGILWSGPQACELAVESGGEDFIDWIVTAAGHGSARPAACSDLEKLAAATLAKAG
ncbi:hypothetical protein ABIA39_008008 [Nocardia sp. GAS34]|uniref:DUF3558 family protein n=1 Tax=unclassified Nocardia TaxID=2637762 RepID=UPI003D1FFE1E